MECNQAALMEFGDRVDQYLNQLKDAFSEDVVKGIHQLAQEMESTWLSGGNVYICGNGGSAANAIHIANDLLYGVGTCSGERPGRGLRVEALSANTAVITCLANDVSYSDIYSHQLEAKACRGDMLLVLSGSGNSDNVVKALETGERLEMETTAIVGFDGGRCKELAHNAIHTRVNDMQLAEDSQLVVGHLCMKWLKERRVIRGCRDEEKDPRTVDMKATQ